MRLDANPKQARVIESLENAVSVDRPGYRGIDTYRIEGTGIYVVHVDRGALGITSAYVGPRGGLTVRNDSGRESKGKDARITWGVEVGKL